MAKIRIHKSHKNLLLAAGVKEATGAEFSESEDGQWVTIEDSPKLVIPRYVFDDVLDPDRERAARGDSGLDRAWRGLILNKVGHLRSFDGHKIVIADSIGDQPQFQFRFMDEEQKVTAEHWAHRAGYTSLTAYVRAAINAFNEMWEAGQETSHQ